MLIIPAINILGGNVVRLRQGDPTRHAFYSDDPLAVAHRFVAMGARSLYIHDIDSFSGEREATPHLDTAARIASDAGVPVRFGAAISDNGLLTEALERPFALVELHADRIVGTPFLRRALARHGERLTLRLDVRDGYVQVRAPERRGPADPVALARELVEQGARRLVYSDLNRDGMLGGPNYAGLRALLQVAEVPVTVSGGIAHGDHIRNLERLGAEAAIIGKALYTGDLSLRGHLDDQGHWRR